MATNNDKLLNRREALTWLGAAGAVGFIGSGKSGSERGNMHHEMPGGSHRGPEIGDSTMKTIGVLGGLGPQATMDFEARVHEVAQRLIPQFQNSGYPPMFVWYCRHPPILLNEDHTPRLPIQPDPRLLKAAQHVGALADFIVITSNTPHLVLGQIEQAAGCKVLSMIEVTLKNLQERQWRKLGILGLGNPVVYTKPLAELNLACETIAGDLSAGLDKAIMKVMEGRDDAESAAIAREAIAALRAKKVDGIILGCTELPLLLRNDADQADLVNPAQLLAEAAVKHALA